jgi:hypothetical protein
MQNVMFPRQNSQNLGLIGETRQKRVSLLRLGIAQTTA